MIAAMLTFLNRLDQAMAAIAKPDERLDMYVLGRSAMVLHHGFQYSTKDVDIVSMHDRSLETQAIELFGRDAPLAQELDLYLDVVAPGLPPLPRWFKARSEQVTADWKVIRVWKLDLHDLAATKLKSFRANDRDDLQALCDRGLLNAADLRASLDAAFPLRSPKPVDAEDDPDDPDCSRAFANLRRVEMYLKGQIRSL